VTPPPDKGAGPVPFACSHRGPWGRATLPCTGLALSERVGGRVPPMRQGPAGCQPGRWDGLTLWRAVLADYVPASGRLETPRVMHTSMRRHNTWRSRTTKLYREITGK